jgi:alpha-tubulin suppressor-like RCC1 family protein
VNVSGLTSGAAAVSAGYRHTCAVTTAGEVKCWGWNTVGQLGDGTTTQRTTPVNVSGLTSGVAAIAAAPYYTCALSTAGGVQCWGYNFYGQLGNGTSGGFRSTPVEVCASGQWDEAASACLDTGQPSGLTGITALAAGGHHTCALTTAGGVQCWGKNTSGQLGDGTTTNRTTPVNVSGLTSGVATVSAGYSHSCAVTTAGAVRCWGSILGTVRTTPVEVSGLTSGVAAVAAGYNHSCAVTSAGGVKCWGANADGQLGDGTTRTSITPVAVSGLTSGVAGIAAGKSHTCALTTAGDVQCWGNNSGSQLGDGTTTNRTTPVDVLGLKPRPGDADCNGLVNSIDAALVLQSVAGLIVSLLCPENADANEDGTINAIDAALILQYGAGLIDGLPP